MSSIAYLANSLFSSAWPKDCADEFLGLKLSRGCLDGGGLLVSSSIALECFWDWCCSTSCFRRLQLLLFDVYKVLTPSKFTAHWSISVLDLEAGRITPKFPGQ